jgi:GntR family transcriptional regulator
MYFKINSHSGKPIYQQLKDQIKKAVASGQLTKGEKLPSVRELALELKINPNTAARSYRELKQEGFLETARGRGTFVNVSPQEIDNPQGEKIFTDLLQKVMTEAYQQGLSQKTVEKKFFEVLANWKTRLDIRKETENGDSD